jgi:hypothetical protein
MNNAALDFGLSCVLQAQLEHELRLAFGERQEMTPVICASNSSTEKQLQPSAFLRLKSSAFSPFPRRPVQQLPRT